LSIDSRLFLLIFILNIQNISFLLLDLNLDNELIAAVAASIRQFCQSTLDTSSIERLTRFAGTIVCQKLWGRLYAAASERGTTVEQQSLSIIAPLFSAKGKTRLRETLQEYMESDDTTLFMKFQSIVVNSARQGLFHSWNETDPLGARLRRNLNMILNKDERFSVFPNDHPEYVCLKEGDDLKSDLPCLNNEEIEVIAASIYSRSRRLSDFITDLFGEIKKLDYCSHVIRKDDLFAALRAHKTRMAEDELKKWFTQYNPDPETELIRKKIIASVIPKIEVKLDQYSRNNKLSSEIVNCFRLALADLLTDYTLGGPAQSNFQYLKTHWETMTYDDYRNRYRSRFEYLAECVKNEFVSFMKNIYKNNSAINKKCD